MKNLYIFGDSFGEEVPLAFPPNNNFHSRVMSLVSYHGIIRSSGLFSNVYTLAEGGSNFWNQFQVFQETLEKIKSDDTVIWFETHPGRLRSRCGHNLPNINSVEKLRSTLTFISDRADEYHYQHTLFGAAIDYFKFLQRDDYDDFAHISIKNFICKIRPDVYWIPCFVTKQNGLKHDQVLSHAYAIENFEFNKHIDVSVHIDLRRNHMIAENHKIFACNLIESIEKKVELKFDNFVKPQPSDCSIYFEKR